MKYVGFGFVLMLLIAMSGCAGGDPTATGSPVQFEASADFDFAYRVTTQTRLELAAISGSIDIVGVPGLEFVYIEGTRRIVSNIDQTDADNRLSTLQVFALQNSSEISIETDQPQDTNGRQYLVDYEIRMPDNMTLLVVQVAGAIEVDSLHNSVTLANVTGAVDLTGLTGNLAASVVTGALSVSCEVPTGGSVSLTTITGPVMLSIPTTTSANLQANTVTGGVSISNLVLSNQVIQANSVSGVLGDGDGSITLSATTGNIIVTGI